MRRPPTRPTENVEMTRTKSKVSTIEKETENDDDVECDFAVPIVEID